MNNHRHYRRNTEEYQAELKSIDNDHIEKGGQVQDLEKTSKNVKEQKKKLFGASGNPATKSSKGQAQMEALKGFAQRRYGVDIVPSKGKFDPKKGEYRKKNAKIGTDKPDWRGESGYEISSQSNSGAQSHELGHLEQMPVGRKAHEHQTIMDQEVGEAVKYGGGPTASFRHPSEVQARAAENPLRRRAGLPPHTPTADVSEGDPMRVVLGTQNEPAAVRYVDKKGKLVDQLKSGKLLSPENRQRMQDIDEGILRYDHKQGWAPSNDNNALINLRGQGRQEEAAQRLKQKYSNPNPQQSAIDLSSLSEDDHAAVQGFLAQRRGKLAASEDYDDLEKGIKLTHYSKQQGLNHLDPEYMGTGAPSEENKQGIPSVKQTSYYREGVEPESVVASGAKSRYTVEHPDESALYDIYEDPQGLVAESFKQQGRLDRNHMAQTLRDAGYHGFYTTHPHYAKQGVVNLFHKMPITSEEQLDKAFSSQAQRRFAYANPEKFGGQKGIKEWESETPKNIPEKVEDDLKKGLRDKLKAIFSPKSQSQGNPNDPWLGINDQKPVYRRRYAHFQGTHGKPNLPKSEDYSQNDTLKSDKKRYKQKWVVHDTSGHPLKHHDSDHDHFGHPVSNNSFFIKSEEENYPELIKSTKDMKAMLGPNLSPEHQEHIKWASSKLPNSNWQIWATRQYKKDPNQFTPEVKQKIEHFGGSQHIPEIAKVRFEKEHDLNQGIKMLHDAEDSYNNRIKSNKNLVKPNEKTKKVVHVPNSESHWHGLGVGACSREGKAMGHCGNVPSRVQGDKVLSLRTAHSVKGQEYHEPHLTFISNNGFLGEMKGRGNQKPSKQYHRHIVELLKNPNIKGVLGGGYESEKNFSFEDLSAEHQQEVLKHNPNLITGTNGNENIEKIIAAKLPDKHSYVRLAIAKNPNLDPKHHERLVGDDDSDVRLAIAKNPNLDPKHHERLVGDDDWDVRLAIAKNPNLDPKHHERLVGDDDWLVRAAIAKNPNLDPKHHERLVGDDDWNVRLAIAENPNLDPKHHERLVGDDDSDVRAAIAENPAYIKSRQMGKSERMSEDYSQNDTLKSDKELIREKLKKALSTHKAVDKIETVKQEEDELMKANTLLRDSLIAGALSIGATGYDTVKNMKPNAPQAQVQQVQPAMQQPAQAEKTPELSMKQKILKAIKMVESSGGKDTNHAMVSHGLNANTKAVGSYGLMPITIKEVVSKHPDLSQKYRDIAAADKHEIPALMEKYPKIEKEVAGALYDHLAKDLGHDPSKIGFAWLNGKTGAMRAIKSGQNIDEHWHVKKVKKAFDKISKNKGLQGK